jgi:addiction module RelB/DinJ family antitoxin
MFIAQRNLQMRLDEKLLKRAEKIFMKIGINTPTAVRIFFSKVVNSGGIPFMLDDLEDKYSPAQIRSIKKIAADAEKGIGISKGYTDVGEFLKDLRG